MGILSNYCGLGGSGPVQHQVDALCKKHDEQYQAMITRGQDPYTHWNDADRELIDGLRKINDPQLKAALVSLGASSYFKIKEKLLHLLGRQEYHDSEDEPSQSNLPQIEHITEEPMSKRLQITQGGRNPEQQNMGDRAPEEGGEQQVEEPKHVWRRFPNTETAALKWVSTQIMSVAGDTSLGAIGTGQLDPFDNQTAVAATNLLAGGGGNWAGPVFGNLLTVTKGYDFSKPFMIQLRMTSPYNILRSFGVQGTSVGNAQPVWLDVFDQKYTYYHVLDTEWSLNFAFKNTPNNGTSDTVDGENIGLYILWRYTNEDDPPTTYSITTTGLANSATASATTGIETGTVITAAGLPFTENLVPDDYFRMGGWHHKHVMLNTTHATLASISGKYHYGQCKMDIKTLSTSDAHSNSVTAEGWAQRGSTPVFPENLSVLIMYDNRFVSGTTTTLLPASVRMEAEQTIQFKDLTAMYIFPTPQYATSAGATSSKTTDIQSFWRGAAYT